jgi:tetratricopeptide (TPR) repeat protein
MTRLLVCFLILLTCAGLALGDQGFDQLIKDKKYKEAIDYAEANISFTDRNADILVKLARAYEEIGFTEKALACYMVSWRMNPKDYASLLGAAKIHNQMNQPDKAMTMAQKALEQNFTGEASWEYARACIAMKRPGDAKKALEKVIETDPSNVIANRELGLIYFGDGRYKEAIPLLLVSYKKEANADVAFKIGKSYMQTDDLETATDYLL